MTQPPGHASSPLSEEHLRQLGAAQFAMKKIRRAVSYAKFDGWTIGIFGALSLVCGFNSFVGVAMAIGLLSVAWIELNEAKKLARLDPAAPRTLAFNQLALAGLLIAYALWRIHEETSGQGIIAAAQSSDPEVAKMLKPYEDLGPLFAYAIYGALICVAVFAQGGTALYYFTRATLLQNYVAHTPPWIVEMQRTGAPL